MVVIPNKFIFVHNPKVAGTAVRQQLMEHEGAISHTGSGYIGKRAYDSAHLPLSVIERNFPNTYKALQIIGFGFVRNPYARCASAWVHSVRVHKAMNKAYPYKTLTDYLKMAATTKKYYMAHGIPQYRFFFNRGKQMVNWQKIEEVENKVIQIGPVTLDMRVRANEQKKVEIEFDDNAKEIICSIYKKDFEVFDYAA